MMAEQPMRSLRLAARQHRWTVFYLSLFLRLITTSLRTSEEYAKPVLHSNTFFAMDDRFLILAGACFDGLHCSWASFETDSR
jgi:hypothetical protein